jgi:hypothetical protein
MSCCWVKVEQSEQDDLDVKPVNGSPAPDSLIAFTKINLGCSIICHAARRLLTLVLRRQAGRPMQAIVATMIACRPLLHDCRCPMGARRRTCRRGEKRA